METQKPRPHAEDPSIDLKSELCQSVISCIRDMADQLDLAASVLVAEIAGLNVRLKDRTAELEETRRLLEIARRSLKEVEKI